MFAWIAENWGTLLVGAAVLAAVGAVVVSMVRRKKRGGSLGGCSCGCGSCSMCGGCQPAPKKAGKG